MSDGTEIKDQQRAVWSAGDYAAVARTIEPAATDLIDRLGIEAGQDVLDVACGTGNATIPAAQRGAIVTGLDLTPKLVEIARERAAGMGVDATFVEGDAEELPFEDGSFDRVTSFFGAMFAPDHRRTADELVRVCREGGRIGFCAWTPDGLNGRILGLLGSYLPPPPEGFTPPTLWGAEEHVGELLGASGLQPEFVRRSVAFEDESIDHWVGFHEATLGPVIMARAALEATGDWAEARAALVSLYEEANESTDAAMRVQAEYLVTTTCAR